MELDHITVSRLLLGPVA